MKKSLIALGMSAMFAVGTANAGNAFGSTAGAPGQAKAPGTSATGLSFSFANGQNVPKTNNGLGTPPENVPVGNAYANGQNDPKTNNGNHTGQQ